MLLREAMHSIDARYSRNLKQYTDHSMAHFTSLVPSSCLTLSALGPGTPLRCRRHSRGKIPRNRQLKMLNSIIDASRLRMEDKECQSLLHLEIRKR
jgi:hypothetical protein